MARYGYTLTVDTGEIPSSQSNFAWKLSEGDFPTAAIDGGGTSILNGGGNVRCYTDDTKTTQLPIEIQTFVTGGTPDVLMFGLSSTLGVGDTVYLEADTVAVSQPAASSTYGSESVWVDWLFVSHDLTSDSTGNFTGAFTEVGSPTQVDGPFGSANGAYDFDGTNRIDVATGGTNPLPGTSTANEFTTMAWLSSSSANTFNRAVSFNSPFANRNVQLLQNVDGTNYAVRTSNSNASTTGRLQSRSGSDVFEMVLADGTMTEIPASKEIIVDNTSANTNGTTGLGAGTSGASDITFGARNDAAGTYFGRVSEVWHRMSLLADDYKAALYNNQRSGSTFWVAGAWEDQDPPVGTIIPVIMNQLRNQGIQ